MVSQVFLKIKEEKKIKMKVCELIQILCMSQPDTEVFLSKDGFPIEEKV